MHTEIKSYCRKNQRNGDSIIQIMYTCVVRRCKSGYLCLLSHLSVTSWNVLNCWSTPWLSWTAVLPCKWKNGSGAIGRKLLRQRTCIPPEHRVNSQLIPSLHILDSVQIVGRSNLPCFLNILNINKAVKTILQASAQIVQREASWSFELSFSVSLRKASVLLNTDFPSVGNSFGGLNFWNKLFFLNTLLTLLCTFIQCCVIIYHPSDRISIPQASACPHSSASCRTALASRWPYTPRRGSPRWTELCPPLSGASEVWLRINERITFWNMCFN